MGVDHCDGLNAFIPIAARGLQPISRRSFWTPSLSQKENARRPMQYSSAQQSTIICGRKSESPSRSSVSESSDSQSTYFATCARGLGDVLADELRASHIKAEVLHIAASGVRFRSTEAGHITAYKACLWLRTATRVLHHVFTTSLDDVMPHDVPDAVYTIVKHGCDWRLLLSAGRQSFSVQIRMSSAETRLHSERLLQMRVKDAICDSLRDAHCDKPPRPQNHGTADMPLFLTLNNGAVSLYQDMAGASLHKRGYRANAALHRSTLNEAVAAGMLYLAGMAADGTYAHQKTSSGDVMIVDPMCGSGTLLIEAALLRLQVAVGLYRREPFPFENWYDFDADAYEHVRRTAIEAQRSDDDVQTTLVGSDINGSALALAERDVHRTRLSDIIELKQADIRSVRLANRPTIVICNPPWGKRLEEDDAWYDIGQFLRREAPESTAVLLSGDASVTRGLRMKARNRHPLRIGNMDTRVLVYDVLPKLKRKDQLPMSV